MTFENDFKVNWTAYPQLSKIFDRKKPFPNVEEEAFRSIALNELHILLEENSGAAYAQGMDDAINQANKLDEAEAKPPNREPLSVSESKRIAARARIAAGTEWNTWSRDSDPQEVRRILRECAAAIETEYQRGTDEERKAIVDHLR